MTYEFSRLARLRRPYIDVIIRQQYPTASKAVMHQWCKEWHVEIGDIYRRAGELGVRRDLEALRQLERLKSRPSERVGKAPDPLIVSDKDDDYVAACLAGGGFVYAVNTPRGIVHVRPVAASLVLGDA